MPQPGRHCVAVIGGAVAGAEVAGTLADAGVRVVVFEQNPRPYGKIEDGLPRWHVELRRKEYERIGAHLGRDEVHFVPLTHIGRDIAFPELVNEWGFSGVVLANGAWRDRPLPVEGADAYLGRGLIYQNPFIVWFNHAEEPDFTGERFETRDGAIVVGGGLASIDVVKVLMLETTRAALRGRGVEVDMVELEVKGIPRMLEAHGLAFEDLGLEGCTLYYRRRVEDMPLVEIPEGATPERAQKVAKSREKLLQKAVQKYCFQVEPLCMPDALLVEGERLAGLRFRRTRMEAGRPVPTDETFERRGSYVISSIGSIPEPIEGIPTRGELFDFVDWELGRLAAYPRVFSAGNIVTGKGNIVASRKHAREVAAVFVEAFLGLGEKGHDGEGALAGARARALREQASRIASEIQAQSAPDPGTIVKTLARVRERQRAVGYRGDFTAWIRSVGVSPPQPG
jgi:ferredoxin--NADP+ reductase